VFLFLRILVTASLVLLLAWYNREDVNFWFFGKHFSVAVGVLVLAFTLIGFLLNRWVAAFQQISLIEIIKEYSRKVTSLENALREKEKDENPRQPKE